MGDKLTSLFKKLSSECGMPGEEQKSIFPIFERRISQEVSATEEYYRIIL